MGDETLSLGTEARGDLARRVLRDWQVGLATEAEELETCPDCGGLLGFEDPAEREMVEQWTSWQPTPVGPGGVGNGWLVGGLWGLASDGSPGWPFCRDEDL